MDKQIDFRMITPCGECCAGCLTTIVCTVRGVTIRNRASKCTCSSGDTTAGYHEFCQHTSSCPANIDS